MSPRPRTVLSASVVLGVVAGLVAALLGVMRPAPQRQEHASLPGACTTVSAATLDTYVSGAARAVAGQTTGGRREQRSCSWSGLVGAQARFLYVRITVYRSVTAAADARATFAAAPSSDDNCRCQGRTQAVPGLGDQAKTVFLDEDVDLPMQSGSPIEGGTYTAAYVLVVRSGNAVVNVAYHATSYGPGAAVPGQLAATTAAARDALAVLGGRAPFPARVVSHRYRAPAEACRLIPPAVVARYLPGKVVSWDPGESGEPPPPPPSTDVATCSWHQQAGIASVGVSLSLVPFADGITQEQERLQTDMQLGAPPGPSPGPGQQSVVVQVTPVAGVADQAAVVFRLDTADGVTTRVLYLIFWAGDAEVVLNLNYRGPAAPPQAVRLADAVAIARSIVGVLDHPPKPWVRADAIDS